MFTGPSSLIKQRISALKKHLSVENKELLPVVDEFKRLDAVAYRMGLLASDQSYAADISWWPVVSVMGTFSSGKSSFINQFLGEELQKTGNQAVDDKFTVLCYTKSNSRTLPGSALDADMRFPFFQISEEIEKVSLGEGAQIDRYLQLTTSSSDALIGKVFIDSPGFDADEQRQSVLKLTDHIADLSDLVLVFFDARHPEPGAMEDTLRHLVASSVRRSDAGKFLFVLNQIDVTANEDNVEEVVAAWQRALEKNNIQSGDFFLLYNEAKSIEITDEAQRDRYKERMQKDLAAIMRRVDHLHEDRMYRVLSALEAKANFIDQTMVPKLKEIKDRWMWRVLFWDAAVLILLACAAVIVGVNMQWLSVAHIESAVFDVVLSRPIFTIALLVTALGSVCLLHHVVRCVTRNVMVKQLRLIEHGEILARAFFLNTRFWRSIFRPNPVGWGMLSSRKLAAIRQRVDGLVQSLNDRYAQPSGDQVEAKIKSDQ